MPIRRPLEKQMAIEDVADRAPAYGFKGHVVSGNDLLAVVQLSEKVIHRVREGGGPALIECKTYRYRGHSEHDPALYRDKQELIEWQSRDPIPRYELYLETKGHDVKRLARRNRRAQSHSAPAGGRFCRSGSRCRTRPRCSTTFTPRLRSILQLKRQSLRPLT